MKAKIYVEYKVKEDQVPMYLESIDIISSLYKSLNIHKVIFLRSRDDNNRFIEEVYVEEAILIETVKSKRRKLHDKISERLSIGPMKMFTFSPIELTEKTDI